MLNCSLRLLLVGINSRQGQPENTEPQSADPHYGWGSHSTLWYSLWTTPDRPLPGLLHGPLQNKIRILNKDFTSRLSVDPT